MSEQFDDDLTRPFVPLVAGTTVSHFRIVGPLGAGGMGEVFLADDTQLDRRVALKFLPTQYLNDSDLKLRFLREARSAAKLSHPNIITIYEVSEFNGRPYFAMEYVEGKSIHSHLQDAPLGIPQILGLAIQVGEGLKSAHAQGIIHRDIKSANIIVGTDGRIRILDFGLAAMRGSEKLTRDGHAIGTVAYMSPEQIRGLAVDMRSDLFSFGVVLYELVTGRTPFKRDSEAATMSAISTDTAEPLARYKSNVPPALQQVIEKALQKDASMRYQTAADFIADLKRIQSDISSPSVPSMPASKPILAVLPFDNTGSTEREYFADGITDEVIARLARVKEIGVISLSSSAQYKKSTKRPRDIGNELGCGYLLQGSIRWDESSQPVRLRIGAKLIKVQDETYVWAETYDRVLDQIFTIQSEIADQVSKAMGVTLAASPSADSSTGATTNMDAYDLYLRAREYFPASIERKEVRESAILLRQALQLDPKFAIARALLGWNLVANYFLHDRVLSHLSESKDQIEKALADSPNLCEAHVAMGFYHYWGLLEYEQALIWFNKAMAIRPNDAEIIFAIAMVERRQGKFQESFIRGDLATRLNPRSTLYLINQAQTLLSLKRYDEAVAIGERALTLSPSSTYVLMSYAFAVACRDGSMKAGARLVEGLKDRFVDFLGGLQYFGVVLYLSLHDGDAGKAYDNLGLNDVKGTSTIYFLQVRLMLTRLAGRSDLTRAYAEAVVSVVESKLEGDGEDPMAMTVLALAYADLGMADKAREIAALVPELPSFRRDPIGRYPCLLHLMELYARLGDITTALSYLEQTFKSSGLLSPALIAELPFCPNLHKEPRFWQILGLPDRSGVA